MSPSIEYIEKRIGRPLKKGDVLVSMGAGTGRDLVFEEIINPSVLEDSNRINISSRETIPAVKIRELTSIGPVSEYGIYERDMNCFLDVIKLKNRTDISMLKKLRLEIGSLLKK